MLINRIPSLIIVLLVMLPNFLFFILQPRNIPEKIGGLSPILDIIEKIGRIATFVTPFFYILKLNNITMQNKVALGGMLFSLVFYYICWARFFFNGRDYVLLFSPIFHIPLPMAIFPLMYFVFSALLLKSFPLLISTVVFAVGHLSFGYIEYLNSRS